MKKFIVLLFVVLFSCSGGDDEVEDVYYYMATIRTVCDDPSTEFTLCVDKKTNVYIQENRESNNCDWIDITSYSGTDYSGYYVSSIYQLNEPLDCDYSHWGLD